MSSIGQKDANGVTRSLLEDLISAGKTDSEMASELGVSRRTIIRYRKKFDLQPNLKKIDENSLQELHSVGFTDELIADKLGCTRQNVAAIRKRLGLEANRNIGERGNGKVKDDTTYVIACTEALRSPIVNKAIRVAAKNHLSQGGSEHTAWAATIVAPSAMLSVEPYVAGVVDNMTQNACGKISDYEKRAERIGMAGVPGSAILELYRLIESGQDNIGLIRHLAAEAVKQAGYVNADATKDQIERTVAMVIDPEEWHEQWQDIKKQATAWAPKEDPPPRTSPPDSWFRPAFEPHCCFQNLIGGNGKKGKGGGIQNQSSAVGFTAVSRV